jgi:predicted phosphodiesterase
MRIAVLADIHGNLPALEAVSLAIERLQPDYVVVDGDLINPIPFSGDVLNCVRCTDWAVVRGNHEFYFLDFGTARAVPGSDDPERWGCLHWLMSQISIDQARYLAALPDERTLYFPGTQPIRVSHGVPGRNRVGFYQEMPAEKIVPEIREIAERTIISAHTHVQVDRHLSLLDTVDPFADPHDENNRYFDGFAADGATLAAHWHLINPGSVGLPLNADPRAQFALLESVPEEDEPGGWRVTHHRIEYDRRPALDAFHSSGLLKVGGVVAHLFYWEMVTAEPEIIAYYQWCRTNNVDADNNMSYAFAAYKQATGRDRYIASHDPLAKAVRS